MLDLLKPEDQTILIKILEDYINQHFNDLENDITIHPLTKSGNKSFYSFIKLIGVERNFAPDELYIKDLKDLKELNITLKELKPFTSSIEEVGEEGAIEIYQNEGQDYIASRELTLEEFQQILPPEDIIDLINEAYNNLYSSSNDFMSSNELHQDDFYEIELEVSLVNSIKGFKGKEREEDITIRDSVILSQSKINKLLDEEALFTYLRLSLIRPVLDKAQLFQPLNTSNP